MPNSLGACRHHGHLNILFLQRKVLAAPTAHANLDPTSLDSWHTYGKMNLLLAPTPQRSDWARSQSVVPQAYRIADRRSAFGNLYAWNTPQSVPYAPISLEPPVRISMLGSCRSCHLYFVLILFFRLRVGVSDWWKIPPKPHCDL